MKPEQPQEEEFTGEVQEKAPAEKGRLTVEQMTQWYEARDILQERLKRLDPKMIVEFDEQGLKVGFLDSIVMRKKKAPGLLIKHEDLEGIIGSLQGSMMNPDIPLTDRIRKNLEKIVDQVSRVLKERLEKH
jgi:hypothetical protein